jgi:hypothetical protein
MVRLCPLCTQPIPQVQAALCSAECAVLLEQITFGYLARTQQLTTDEFHALLHVSPLRDWAREIVWCTARTSAIGRTEFIVVEDYTLADVRYRQVNLPPTRIRALYPPPDQWAEVLWDMEMVPLNIKRGLPLELVSAIQHEWLLQRLLKHESLHIRRKIILNPHIDSAWLAHFARDPAEKVRRAVAWLPQIAPALLQALAEDPAAPVRYEVAHHPELPAAALLRLARDPDHTVKMNLARHPKLSREAAELLAQDADWRVRRQLVSYSAVPLELLAHLATDPAPEVRILVAARGNTPLPLIWQLSRDPHPSVRQQTAYNPSSPLELLETLLQDSDPNVVGSARYYLQLRQK